MAITTAPIPTTSATITYTSVGDSAVTFMSLCNHSASPVIVDIHIVPNTLSATTDNIMISALEIVADDTYILYQGGEKLILENGDKIVVVATVGAVVSTVTSYVAV